MKRACIVASALLLLSLAAFASPAPSPVALSDEELAAILSGSPLGNGACSTSKPAARFDGLTPKATCTVQCPSGSVTCTAGSCVGVNRNCDSALEPGHVTCNGVTTNCTPACCSTGTLIQKACCRCAATGGCFDCCRCDGGGPGPCAIACG